MRHPFLNIFLFLLISVAGFSQNQETQSSEFTKELGMNMSFFVKNLMRENVNFLNSNSSNYLLEFKTIKNQQAFRMGFGIESSMEKMENADEKSKYFSVSLRMGYEYQKRVADRWQVNLGGDFSLNRFSFENRFFTDNSTVFRFGIGPMLGIQYHINERVRLRTEMILEYAHTVVKNGLILDSSQPNRSDYKINNVGLALPGELFLSFLF